MEMEEGQENDEDDNDDVDETGSRVGEEEQDERPGKGFNCVPKTEEMHGFIGALSWNECGKIFHRWCYIS